jgi:hypothetical protein
VPCATNANPLRPFWWCDNNSEARRRRTRPASGAQAHDEQKIETVGRLRGCEIDGEPHARGDGAVEIHHPLEFVRHEQVGAVRRRIGTDGLVRIARRIGPVYSGSATGFPIASSVFSLFEKPMTTKRSGNWRTWGACDHEWRLTSGSGGKTTNAVETPTSGFVSGLVGLSARLNGTSAAIRSPACAAPTAASSVARAVCSFAASPSARHTAGQYAASAALSPALGAVDAGITRITSVVDAFVGFGGEGVGVKLSTSQPARPEPCAATRLRHAPRSSFSTPPARQIFIQ